MNRQRIPPDAVSIAINSCLIAGRQTVPLATVWARAVLSPRGCRQSCRIVNPGAGSTPTQNNAPTFTHLVGPGDAELRQRAIGQDDIAASHLAEDAARRDRAKGGPFSNTNSISSGGSFACDTSFCAGAIATKPRSIGQQVQCFGVVYTKPLAGTQPFLTRAIGFGDPVRDDFARLQVRHNPPASEHKVGRADGRKTMGQAGLMRDASFTGERIEGRNLHGLPALVSPCRSC